MVKRPYKAASGAVHLIGNLAPEGEKKQRKESQAGAARLQRIFLMKLLAAYFLKPEIMNISKRLLKL